MDNLRRCTVKLKDGHMDGFFHCWEQVSQVIEPSNIRGGHGGGVVAQMFGLVEDEKTGKIWRCQPYDITFVREDSENGN